MFRNSGGPGAYLLLGLRLRLKYGAIQHPSEPRRNASHLLPDASSKRFLGRKQMRDGDRQRKGTEANERLNPAWQVIDGEGQGIYSTLKLPNPTHVGLPRP